MAPKDGDNDPRQDKDFRRALRGKFRNLDKTVHESKDELIDLTGDDKLDGVINLIEDLHQHVLMPREQLQDATVMATIADMGVEKAKKMGGAGTTPAQFMTRLCRQFVVGVDPDTQAETDEGAFNWTLFGSSVGKHFHEAPTMAFMNGAMDTQIKERRVAQRLKRDPVGPAVAPDSVADTKDDMQTDQAMKRMVKVLKNKKHQNETLTVEQLSANPKSFSQFIENIFTLSFLVKDGEAGLTPAPGAEGPGVEKCPQVRKMKKPEEQQVDRSTFVLHLDMEGWRRLCDANGGVEGAIPHREEVVEMDLTEGNGIVGPGAGARAVDGEEVDSPSRAENPRGKAKPRGRGTTRPRDSTNSRDSEEMRQTKAQRRKLVA